MQGKVKIGLWAMVGGWLLILAGCGLDAGLSFPRDIPPTTAQSRTALETIPSAQLVREDTMPRWPLGRFAFKRGVDRLLVATNITSLADYDADSKTYKARTDRFMERLWVTIPEGTRLGQELDLEELDYKHVVGYDAGDVGDAQFVEPYKVSGHLAILEEKPDAVVMYLNILVEPKRRLNWSVKGTFTVAQTMKGIHATMVAPGPLELYPTTAPISQAPVTVIAPIPTTGPASDNARPQLDASATQPAASQPATQPAAQAQPNRARTLVGLWTTNWENQEYNFQFLGDGTVLWSWGRGFEALKHIGVYRQTGDNIGIVANRAYWGIKKNVEPITSTGFVLHVTWKGDTPILSGSIEVGSSIRPGFTGTLHKGSFPDMRYFSWSGMEGGYQIVADATPFTRNGS